MNKIPPNDLLKRNPGNQQPALPVVDIDTEHWIRERICTAMRMALSLRDQRRVSADENAFGSAFEGIANGTAVEIIYLLENEPGFINLRRPYNVEMHKEGITNKPKSNENPHSPKQS